MIAAIVLCAGASSRMGRPKALLPLGEGTFLSHILATARAAGIGPAVAVVAEPHGAAIQAAEAHRALGCLWAWNPQPEHGMLTSVQAGVRALPEVRGALIWPVDCPAVQKETLLALIGAAAGDAAVIVPTFQEKGGHPLYLPAMFFPALLSLPWTESLRALRRGHPLVRLPVTDAAVLHDLDLPADVTAALAPLKGLA